LFGERLEIVRKNKHLTQQEISTILGITQSNYNKYHKGYYKITLEMLRILKEKLDVSVDWFLNGEGEMFLNNSQDTNYNSQLELQKIIDTLKEELKLKNELLELYRKQK